MRIAYDPQVFSLQPFGGISRYFVETARCLAAIPDTEVRVLAFAHLNAYLEGLPQGLVIGARGPRLPQPLRPALARANRVFARGWLARHPVDVVHETYYARDPARRGARCVITVLDMIHERYPHFAPGVERVVPVKRAAILRADHVICISENTRRDLHEVYAIDPARTSVVRLGFAFPRRNPQRGERPVASPYILYVGKRDGYKNFATLLAAYAASARLQREFRLLCFGDSPFGADERAAFARAGLAPDRVWHRRGGDDALADAYRNASVFVYPSAYEGFGIPPLEAMSFDCPVVSSSAASLPEVVGDAALGFEPEDAEALRAALERVLDSPALAEDLRRRGRERLSQFSWERCARETRAVYASLL